MKTYFITYQWKRAGKWEMDNVLTKELPIRWLIGRRTEHREILVISFQELELTEAEYKEYAKKV